MTDDRQAVKTLAEQLAKAMKSVSAKAPSSNRNYGGSSPSTIQASKIVGLPAAFSSIISSVESSAAGGDAVAQQTLSALNHIAAGEFETITADTAMIEKIYATFGDFITLVAEDAHIGSLDVETIRAGLAEVGLLNIGTASIDMAQIKRSSTQTAFIHESVQGKVYIDDLAVNDASIVNLAAGTVLINDNSGNLVELYVDDHGDVSTRAVSYDGSDIINQSSLNGNTIINNTLNGNAVITNSLNGNKIISNSITTTQLNANEIFAAQGTIMDLIADNIEATRLFANQGFITELQSTIISSDLSENSTIIELTDSINLFASNTSRTFIQDYMPIPTHTSDTWFDPTTEEHYVANSIYLPVSQMIFGHDDGGNLCNDSPIGYSFSINANGELMLLVTNEEAEEIILENDINFQIVDNHVYADGLWKKVDNIAFSNLKVSVDGIVSEVYDSTTGESRIEQNADSIIAIVSGDTSVPYVKTSSIEIKNDKVEIKSTGDVDIKANKFSVSFNTSGSAANKNRVDISNTLGIKVSDQYGGYFQATYNKLGLYDSAGNAKLYMNSEGNAVFSGKLEAATGSFAGALNAATGSFAGSLSAATGSFAGELSAATGTFNGTVYANKIEGTKSLGSNWSIDFTNGSMTIGNISASKITSDTMSAARIKGGTLTLGGSDNGNGTIVVNDANNVEIGKWDNNGLTLKKGSIIGPSITLGGINNTNGQLTVKNASGKSVVKIDKDGISILKDDVAQFYVDSAGNVIFKGSLDAATGTFEGTLSAACISSGTLSAGFIHGGTLTLGGNGDSNGNLVVYDVGDNNNRIKRVELNNTGITVYNRAGTVRQFYVNTDGNAEFAGKLSANVVDANSIAAGAISISKFDETNRQRIVSIDSTLTRQQTIYISKPSGTQYVPVNEIWVTDISGKQDTWTTVRPVYDSGYSVLFTAIQRQTNIQHSTSPGTECSCTAPVKDQTTTVIDGAHITTGTIDASVVTVTNIDASNITTGEIDANVITVKNIDGSKIKAGSVSASKIKGGSLTLGGGNNGGNGYIVVYNDNDEVIGRWNKNGIDVLSGTINGASLTLGGASNVSGTLLVKNANGNNVVRLNSNGITVYKGNTKQFYIDANSGDVVFNGTMSANCIKSGTIDADVVTVNNIDGSKIKASSINASKIKGGTLTLGGKNNGSGSLTVADANGSSIGTWDNSGIEITKGTIDLSYPSRIRFLGDGDGTYSEFNKYGLTLNLPNNFVATNYSHSMHQTSSASYPTTNVTYYPLYMAYSGSNKEWDNYISPFGVSIEKTDGSSSPRRKWETEYDVSEIHIKEWKRYSTDDAQEGWEATGKEFSIYLGNTSHRDEFIFSGTKSRVVQTSQYSSRLLYCYETPSPLFGDVGEGQISSDGKCYIPLDPIFAQTISTDQYQVFLQPYGEGNCYISERHGSYFVVSGTPNLQFGWELKAKQSDYDQLRLERNDEKFSVPSQTYGDDAANHIKELYEERTQQDE